MDSDQPTNEPQRKTPDERQRINDLQRLRHSCAHIMATAILRLWPDAQFAYGPPVENGFYYDLELDHRISPEDFPRIEAERSRKGRRGRHTLGERQKASIHPSTQATLARDSVCRQY